MVSNPVSVSFDNPQRSDCAVFIACDAGHEPFAYLIAQRLVGLYAGTLPFDICLCVDGGVAPWIEGISDHVRYGRVVMARPLEGNLVKNVTSATYLRLFVPRYLTGYRRVIYLDTDVYPAGPIHELFGDAFSEVRFGAVRDIAAYGVADTRQEGRAYRKAMAGDQAAYFNAGVLLFDPEHFCQQVSPDSALATIAGRADEFRLMDQSYLNLMFRGDVSYLSMRYNYMIASGTEPFVDRVKPALLHFVGARKPWVRSHSGLASTLNEEYQAMLTMFGRDLYPMLAWERRAQGEVTKYRGHWREGVSRAAVRVRSAVKHWRERRAFLGELSRQNL